MYGGEGVEHRVRSHTAHFTPGALALSYDFTPSALTQPDFYHVACCCPFEQKKHTRKTSIQFYLVFVSLSRFKSTLACKSIHNC